MRKKKNDNYYNSDSYKAIFFWKYKSLFIWGVDVLVSKLQRFRKINRTWALIAIMQTARTLADMAENCLDEIFAYADG